MATVLLAAGVVLLRPVHGDTPGDAPARRSPEPGSAEQVARKAAAPFEKEKGFRLRQDFWNGSLSGSKGKAIRLQLFKGNTYRLILAAGAKEGAAGTRLHVMVIDRKGTVIGESKVTGPTTTVEVTPRKTGAYMVLMRAEVSGGDKDRGIPAVLFYGYK